MNITLRLGVVMRCLQAGLGMCCVLVAMSTLQAQVKSAPPSTAPSDGAKEVAAMLVRHLNEGTSAPLPPLDGRQDVLVEAWRTYGEQPVEVRRLLILYIPILGKDREAVGGWRWVTSEVAVSKLVEVVATDGDSICRRTAARLLVKEVPDMSVRIHAREIVTSVRQLASPDVQEVDESIVMLLGKTGASEARDVLTKVADNAKSTAGLSAIDLALAKLGDTKRERAFIDAFEKSCKPAKQSREAVREAVRHARNLGYIGQPGSVMALARQFRNPLYYRAVGSDYFRVMSLRFAIVNALGCVCPDSSLFSFPYAGTQGDERAYIKVEEWLEGYLGVKWSVPRPTFVEEGIKVEMLGS